MQQPILSTSRLTLRNLNEKDAGFINRLYNTDGFLQFIGDKNIRSPIDAAVYLRSTLLPMHNVPLMGLLAVQLKNHEPIGVCGLIDRDNLDGIDLGFGFFPEYHGQGYAKEAAMAVLDMAKDSLALTEVVAITLETNKSCLKLLKNLGFQKAKAAHPEPEVMLLKLKL
ncbi:Acetyltransferase (GNAT) family protein [Grimontia celer]|uniref:Acetyltransferase (GNAT) family protein n=1 Tax=Grimontia celer TaxID=1796497 RepID=A0A128F6B8_9GAMM|nr:GNAT family N-acetyltransferase [Grimontia celer]CZF82339.1 Acetyltransferase (GNAT) family protein [Grimontia celer]